jgi:hypothetical protein
MAGAEYSGVITYMRRYARARVLIKVEAGVIYGFGEAWFSRFAGLCAVP